MCGAMRNAFAMRAFSMCADNIFFLLAFFCTSPPSPSPVVSPCAVVQEVSKPRCDGSCHGGQLLQVPHIPLSKLESENQRHKTFSAKVRMILWGVGCVPL